MKKLLLLVFLAAICVAIFSVCSTGAKTSHAAAANVVMLDQPVLLLQ